MSLGSVTILDRSAAVTKATLELNTTAEAGDVYYELSMHIDASGQGGGVLSIDEIPLEQVTTLAELDGKCLHSGWAGTLDDDACGTMDGDHWGTSVWELSDDDLEPWSFERVKISFEQIEKGVFRLKLNCTLMKFGCEEKVEASADVVAQAKESNHPPLKEQIELRIQRHIAKRLKKLLKRPLTDRVLDPVQLVREMFEEHAQQARGQWRNDAHFMIEIARTLRSVLAYIEGESGCQPQFHLYVDPRILALSTTQIAYSVVVKAQSELRSFRDEDFLVRHQLFLARLWTGLPFSELGSVYDRSEEHLRLLWQPAAEILKRLASS